MLHTQGGVNAQHCMCMEEVLEEDILWEAYGVRISCVILVQPNSIRLVELSAGFTNDVTDPKQLKASLFG